jgi:hypothetical protein
VAVRRERMGQGSVALGGIRPELDAKGQLTGQMSPCKRVFSGWGPLSLARMQRARLRSRLVDERYGLTLVPSRENGQSVRDLVAQRQRDGWQLVSSRVDSEGAEVMIFRRPA